MTFPGHARRWGMVGLVVILAAGACTRGDQETPSTAASAHSPSGAPRESAVKRGSISVDGRTRTFLLHVPPRLGSPRALVIDLHGGGGRAEGQERISGLDAVADANGFVVVHPQGVERSWADGRGTTPADRSGVDDVGFISALIDTLLREYGIDPRWVFATGLSNGAFMVNRLACELSEKISAVAPVAGTLGTDLECSPALPVAVMAVHGTDDPLVPFEGGRMTGRGGTSTILPVSRVVELWRGINGCPPDGTERTLPDKGEDMTVTVAGWTGCDRDTAVVLYTVIGGGHAWPGGAQYLPERVIGRTTEQFDASAASWDFFRTHPRASR